MRKVNKYPKNSPSVGVAIDDTLMENMSDAARDRDKATRFLGWLMAVISLAGSIANDLNPFEHDDSISWARTPYAKRIDLIRVLAHCRVNESIYKDKEPFFQSYKKLANPRREVPKKQLFGNDLADNLKSCEEDARISLKFFKK